jgi:hypothetical protein
MQAPLVASPASVNSTIKPRSFTAIVFMVLLRQMDSNKSLDQKSVRKISDIIG